MKGRKAKPTTLKLLHGAQKCRINAHETKPVGGIGEPPDWFDDVAREYWRSIMAALGKILTAADRGSLEMLCKSYSRWLQLENELEAKGMTYYPNGVREIVVGGTTKLVGEARRRPQAALANEYYRQYCSLSAEFGLTPTARARVPTGALLDDLDLL